MYGETRLLPQRRVPKRREYWKSMRWADWRVVRGDVVIEGSAGLSAHVDCGTWYSAEFQTHRA